MELTAAQRSVLVEAAYGFEKLSEAGMLAIAHGNYQPVDLDDDTLIEFLEVANLLYRGGAPLISDHQYDFMFLAELRRRQPDHPFLLSVEPEPTAAAKTVELPVRMLSTDKAYDFEAVERWAGRIEKAAQEHDIEFSSLIFRVTPKLDGFAAYDDGQLLYTRGDGKRGTDITRAFERGLQIAHDGARGLGAGEIVVSRKYFTGHLAAHFDNSRNFQASLIKEKELDPPAAKAIKEGAAVFYPFALLPCWEGGWALLAAGFSGIVEKLWHELDFDVDGVVLEIVDPRLREYLGATRHHHRWQLAYKQNTEMAEVRVVQVIAQTSRSGRVNPVAEVEPVRLSGAMIRRATAHHYNMVRTNGIGPGALIRLSRSGEVIPKIEEVLEPSEVAVPASCPSCGGELLWEGEYLQCINGMNCPAQITTALEHFFRTLGNIDGFGPASIQKLYEAGITTLPQIYNMGAADFEKTGFGPKQSENMVAQLLRSRTEPIEDYRFLAAFGVYRMGQGNCERLLETYPLEQVFDLTLEQITKVKGFSEKSGREIVAGMAKVRDLFLEIFALGFTLTSTTHSSGEEEEPSLAVRPFAGKLLVFTGTMLSGSRDDMKKQAKLLGAKVGDSVTGKTDMLICGENVGAVKIGNAEKLGVRILSEREYLAMLE